MRGWWSRRTLFWILLALPVLVYLTRGYALHPLLVRGVERFAPDWFGSQVEIGRLRGNWFRSLILEDVSLEALDDSSPLRSLTAQQAKLEFSPLGLATGGLAGLKSVDLSQSRVVLDTRLGGADDPQAKVPEGAGGFQWPAHLPHIEARELSGLIRFGADQELELDSVNASLLAPEVGSEEIALRLSRAVLTGPGKSPPLLELEELELDGALRGDLHLRVPRWVFSNRAAADLQLDFRLEERQLVAAKLEARQGDNALRAHGLVLPFAFGELADWLHKLRGRLEIESTALDTLLHATREGDPAPAHALSLSARLEQGRALLEEGRFQIAGGGFELSQGRFELTPDDSSLGLLDADLELNLPDLAPLGDLLDPQRERGSWSGSLQGGLRVTGAIEALSGIALLEGKEVSVFGLPFGSIALVARSDREKLTIESLSTEGAAGRASLQGSFEYATERLDAVRLEAHLDQPQLWLGEQAPGARFDLSAELNGEWRRPSGQAALDVPSLELPGLSFEDLRIEATAEQGRIDLPLLQAQTPYGRVDAQAAVELPAGGAPLQFDIAALSLAQDEVALSLERGTRLVLDGASTSLEPCTLGGSAGRLELSWDQRVAQSRLRLVAEKLHVMPFLRSLLPAGIEVGALSTTSDLVFAGESLSGTSQGSLPSLRLEGIEEVLSVEWGVEQAPSLLSIASCRVRSAASELFDLTAELPLRPLAAQPLVEGELQLWARLDYPARHRFRWKVDGRELGVDGELNAALALHGSWAETLGSLEISAPSLMVVDAESAVDQLPEPARLELELDLERRMTLERFELDVPGRGHLNGQGTLEASLDLSSGPQSALDQLRERPLDLALNLVAENLAWLAQLEIGVQRLSGKVEAALEVKGTPLEPSLRGGLELREGELRLASNVPVLEKLEADLEFEGRSINLRRLSAEMGAAPLEATGTIVLEGANSAFDLELQGENVLLARSSDLRVRADADLVIRGPLERLQATGQIGLRNSRLRANIDFLSALQGGRAVPTTQSGLTLFSIREAPLSNMRFDLDIESVEPVEVASNVASGAVRIDLQLGGTGQVPIPRGRIFLEPTRVKLPGGTFTVPSGTVNFREADPFHPELDLRAEGRRAGYDITLDVSGTLENPIVEPRSSPPLERQKLLVLVITGQLPPEDLAASGLAATQAVSIYIAKDLLTQWMTGDEEPDEESFFERIEFVSGSDVSKSGVMTTEASFRLRRGVVDEDDALYLVAERDVWEDYNMGLRLVFRFP